MTLKILTLTLLISSSAALAGGGGGVIALGKQQNANLVLVVPASVKEEIKEVAVERSILNQLKNLTARDAGIIEIDGEALEIQQLDPTSGGGVIINTSGGKKMLVTEAVE